MSDAFQCDRCEEYNDGIGCPVRIGEYTGTSGFSSTYDFWESEELCSECVTELEAVIETFFNV